MLQDRDLTKKWARIERSCRIVYNYKSMSSLSFVFEEENSEKRHTTQTHIITPRVFFTINNSIALHHRLIRRNGDWSRSKRSFKQKLPSWKVACRPLLTWMSDGDNLQINGEQWRSNSGLKSMFLWVWCTNTVITNIRFQPIFFLQPYRSQVFVFFFWQFEFFCLLGQNKDH